MRYFCTYFDSVFIYRGLSLYDSLCSHAGDFILWALCFDHKTYELLEELNLPRLHTISLNEFEAANPALVEIKKTRSSLEYYWTTTPLLPIYIFKSQPHINTIAYLDADLFFYSDVQPIYEEWGSGSIYIIPHRFSMAVRRQEQLQNGIYNVGLVGFRRDDSGLACLDRWASQCLDWCYMSHSEPGKLGDQKYLDDWPSRYSNCIISQNEGIGVGGWNILDYKIQKKDGQIFLNNFKLLMAHLNFIEVLSKHFFVGPSLWSLRPIYIPYAKALKKSIEMVDKIMPNFNPAYYKLSAAKWLVKSIRGGIVKIG